MRPKKTVIKASIRTQRDRVFDLLDQLDDAGATDSTILRHFIDYLPASESIAVLEDLMVELDLDYDEDEE